MKKRIFTFVSIFLLFLSPLLAQENKLIVVANRAGIYLDPDVNSPIIETVERGAILNLLSRGKIQELWYYVTYYSEERFTNVSGFIYALSVEMMYEIPEIIEEEWEEPAEEIEEIEEVLFESPREIQVTLEKANVRAEPDFGSEIIHQVQLGIALQSVGKTGEWYLVNLPLDEEGLIISGYIHQSFVQEIPEEELEK